MDKSLVSCFFLTHGVVLRLAYSSVMLQIVVEVAGTVCDADYSVFS